MQQVSPTSQRMLAAKQALYNAAIQRLHAAIYENANIEMAIENAQQCHLEMMTALVIYHKESLG